MQQGERGVGGEEMRMTDGRRLLQELVDCKTTKERRSATEERGARGAGQAWRAGRRVVAVDGPSVSVSAAGSQTVLPTRASASSPSRARCAHAGTVAWNSLPTRITALSAPHSGLER